MNRARMSSRRDAANLRHLSTRVASSRFATFVCALCGAHASVGHPRTRRISPTRDGACVTRIGAREMLRMCNAVQKPENTSESGLFVAHETGVGFDHHTNARATNEARRSVMQASPGKAPPMDAKPPAVRGALRTQPTVWGRMRRVHTDSSVNQNSPPARLPHPLPSRRSLLRVASRQMAHALLNVRQVRPEALARQQTDGDAKATKPGGDATRSSGATDNRPPRPTRHGFPLTSARSTERLQLSSVVVAGTGTRT